MDKARLGVIIVSSLFLISVIAGSFLYRFPEAKKPVEKLPGKKPMQLNANAKEVKATVVLLLPRMQIIAQTKETDISKIDARLYSIPGIKSVSSRFVLPEKTSVSSNSLTYVADVQLSKDLNAEQGIAAIKEKKIFDSFDAFPYALVSLPEKIGFFSQDLNISIPFSFKENETMAMVSSGTLPGDKLKLEIDATFVGKEPTNVLAFETQNISAMPQPKETTVEAKIAFLEPKLSLDITTNYSKLLSFKAIEKSLASIPGIKDLNLSKPPLDAKVSLIADNNIPTEKAIDLNTFLHSLSNDVIFYNKGFFRASVFFEQGKPLEAIKNTIKEKLTALGLNSITVQEPIGHILGKALLETSDASTALPTIKSVLKNNGFEKFSVTQQGRIALSEITSKGTTFPIEPAFVKTLFSQPHAVGEKVKAKVSFTVIRGKITEISAVEANS